MHLAQLVLDPEQAAARRDLGSAYEMHRTLCRAFAADAATPPERFLWRLEPDTSAGLHEAAVLVQSATPGNWAFLDALPGFRLAGSKSVELDKLLRTGRSYRFRLAANPTVTRARKRFGLVGDKAQQDWLARQGERWGFTVRTAAVNERRRIIVRQDNSGRRIVVDAVRFDGILEARSTALLGAALLQGISHAKALGLGLLSVAPLN